MLKEIKVSTEGIAERFIPGLLGDIELEHMHRYSLAREFVRGKHVLDLASGEGYGSHFLSQVAAKVTGVDIDEPTIKAAQQKYVLPNLEYKQGSCSNIPLPDACVDVVVSFETIEHHTEHEEMMLEIKRVLRPNGLMILSSPDKQWSDYTQIDNPYHVKELYREELERLVSSYFKHYHLSASILARGSLMTSMTSSNVPFLTFQKAENAVLKHTILPSTEYFIVFASDSDLPAVPNSFYEGVSKNDLHEKEVHIRNLTAVLAHKDQYIDHLNRQVEHLSERILWKLIRFIKRMVQ